MAINGQSLIKCLEIVITCICLGLHYHTYIANNIVEQVIISGTFFGYLIILIGGIAGQLMSTPIHRRIDIFFSLVGCALFIASGAFIIQQFESMNKGGYRDKGLAKGSMAIVNGALFLLGALLAWRGDF